MYKLIYKNQFVAGFDADQIVGNLAQLLQLKPKTIRLLFLSRRASVIKLLDSPSEVERWVAAFLEAGVYLEAVSIAAPDADSIADQIELELELHSLDEDHDDEAEPPRQLLVKKVIAPTQVAAPQVAAAVAADVFVAKMAPPPRPAPQAVADTALTSSTSAAVTPKAESKPAPPTPADAAAEEHSEPVDDGHVEVDFHESTFPLGMLAILLAIALTASLILWLKQPLWQPVTAPANAQQIENALATESLFVLAHVDVARVQQLPDVLQSAQGLSNLPAPQEAFWQKLADAGIDIAQQLDQVWISAYRANNQTQPLWVLTGEFNAEAFRAWLKSNYVIDEESSQHIVFSSVDENACAKHPVVMAAIESDRIVLGAPERVAAFRGRMDAAAVAESDLSDWRRISAAQMVSVAVFNPAQFADATTAVALGKLALNSAAVKGIYLGVAPRLLPPVLEFNAIVVGSDQGFIDAAEQNIAPLLGQAKSTIGQDWPETIPIYDRLTFSKVDQELRASVFFDEKVEAQLQLWANSLLTQVAARGDNTNAAAIAQKADNTPRQFNDLTSAELPDFSVNAHLNPALSAQTIAGPFGVSISSIEATADGLAITMDAHAFNLPNLGKDAAAAQLRISDIVDHQDQSLLASNGCDTGDLRRAVAVDVITEEGAPDSTQPQSYLAVRGTKKILLPSHINLAGIGAIKGELSYKVPRTIERVKVDAPLVGKAINAHGLQVRFLSTDANRVQLQYSGNSAALLQVNGLDAKGNLLETVNALRGEHLFGNSYATSIQFNAEVASVEVIVASNLEEKLYPFSFGRIQPRENDFAIVKPAPELLTAAGLDALKADSAPTDVQYAQSPQQTLIAGPALIAVNQMNIQAQQLSLMADIYLRNQHSLTRQLSAVRFFITEVEDSAGNIHPVTFQAPVAMAHQGGGWVDGQFKADANQPWLRGQLDLRGQDLGVSDVIAFWGKLVFLAASDPVAIQLPFQFGMQWNGAESSFKLVRWEAGRLMFDISGIFPELMAISALNENGSVISQAAELRSHEGVNQVELPIKQQPATIEFSIARKQQTAEFPFEIRAQQ